jgi:nucleoside-diphosphate-sugar epimerase
MQVHLIVHCAAMCSPWGLYEDFFRDNVEVTQFLVDAARAEPSVRRFIHISSPSVAFAVDTGPRLAVKETVRGRAAGRDRGLTTSPRRRRTLALRPASKATRTA